jgi:hypothetical protein
MSHSHPKNAQQVRKRHLAEKRELKKRLPEIVAELGALLPRETAISRAKDARTVNGLVRAFALDLEGRECTESRYEVTILGTLSDLALMHVRESPRSQLRALPLETPSDILRWFAAYLEDRLDKPDLRLLEDVPVCASPTLPIMEQEK